MPKGVIKRIDLFRKRMLWQEGVDQKKIHLVNWPSVCQPKNQGGLGVNDLETMNFCLLCKWIWKLENSSGLWQKILRRKYCKGKLLSQISPRQGDSHFWTGILHVRDIFLSFCRRIVGNGKRIRFWEDDWWGGKPFAVQFPRLFNLTFSTDISAHRVFTEGWNVIRFRRTLVGDTLRQWEALKSSCSLVSLSDRKDKLFWKLEARGTFSVGSLYRSLKRAKVPFPYSFLWKIKIPLKIKVFLWLVSKESILTRDVLKQRGGRGSDLCPFCARKETIDHLFFHCSLSRFIWRVAQVCFNFLRTPCSVHDLLILGCCNSLGMCAS